jgi:ribonuclease Z
MKLVLLGTGGYYGNDRRHTACMMLPEIGVLLDAGTALYRVQEYLQTDRLDIFLTHAHLDHVAGLPCLIDVLSPEVIAETTIHGEPEKLKSVREHLFATPLFPVPPPFRFEPLGATCPLAGGGTLSSFSLKHPGGVLGFRLDWPGHSLAYITDTTAASNSQYVDAVRDVDMLLHEAYFLDDTAHMAEVTGHSCLQKVAQIAADARVERLVLVHINPQLKSDSELRLDDAQRIFKNTEIGVDRMELEF